MKSKQMADLVHRVVVFIASPSDVVEERKAIQQAAEDINRAGFLGPNYVVQTKAWETHAWPGFGEDAQDVINPQVGSYDVFVGVMWNRIGTATARAESGTVEEFQRAYASWKKHKIPSLMFYFNRQPADLSTREALNQKERVIAFRETLSKLGALSWEYGGIDEFQSLITRHLFAEIKAHLTSTIPDSFTAKSASAEILQADTISRVVAVGRHWLDRWEAVTLHPVQVFQSYQFRLDSAAISFFFFNNAIGYVCAVLTAISYFGLYYSRVLRQHLASNELLQSITAVTIASIAHVLASTVIVVFVGAASYLVYRKFGSARRFEDHLSVFCHCCNLEFATSIASTVLIMIAWEDGVLNAKGRLFDSRWPLILSAGSWIVIRAYYAALAYIGFRAIHGFSRVRSLIAFVIGFLPLWLFSSAVYFAVGIVISILLAGRFD